MLFVLFLFLCWGDFLDWTLSRHSSVCHVSLLRNLGGRHDNGTLTCIRALLYRRAAQPHSPFFKFIIGCKWRYVRTQSHDTKFQRPSSNLCLQPDGLSSKQMQRRCMPSQPSASSQGACLASFLITLTTVRFCSRRSSFFFVAFSSVSSSSSSSPLKKTTMMCC